MANHWLKALLATPTAFTIACTPAAAQQPLPLKAGKAEWQTAPVWTKWKHTAARGRGRPSSGIARAQLPERSGRRTANIIQFGQIAVQDGEV